MPPFITAQAVAEMIGYDNAAAFLRHRTTLENDQDFPTPMPTCRRPMRWRRDAVAAWLAEQGLPRAETAALPPRPMGKNVVLLEMARTA